MLGLSIDFPDSSYRNKDNLKAVLNILDFYQGLKRRPTIRIGTVVTKDNIRRLDEIGKLLKNYQIDIWKIYEFTPQNPNAIENRSSLEVSEEEFNKVTQEVKDNFSDYFKVIISKRHARSRAYFFIGSDGVVFIPVDDGDICREKKIGSIFDNDILDKWERAVSKENYVKNAELTFDYKF